MNDHLPKELLHLVIFLSVIALLPSQVIASQAVIDLTTASSAPVINLTAQPMKASLPDGNTVPMWGFCTTDTTTIGETVTGTDCSKNSTWEPGPTIIVNTATPQLTINLTNNLPATTSLVILGQLGGGLGSPLKVPSPSHTGQASTTWPVQGTASFTPPAQPQGRVRSFATEVTNNTTKALTWNNLKPGTYLYETGTLPSIQVPMGLYGVLVVTSPPIPDETFSPGTVYPNVAYDADAVMLFSEIDPVQNASVAGVCATVCDETSKYPPAVNYTPKYFLINGQAFDKTAPQNSVFLTSGNTGTTSILVRLANAGSRTHIPAIVGQSMSLVGEDGNATPGNPKVQNEVLLTAGKTYDVTVKPAQTKAGSYDIATYPVFDRALSLSSNNTPDGGMQGFLAVAPTGTTNTGFFSSGLAETGIGNGTDGKPLLPTSLAVTANPDTFMVPPNSLTFTGNVLSNDNGVTSALIKGPAPLNTVTFNTDGSITVKPLAGKPAIVADTFQYCGNGSSATELCTTVTLSLGSAPIANNDNYISSASILTVPQPGVLSNDLDPSNFPQNNLTAHIVANTCGATTLNPDGSFSAAGTSTCSFTYSIANAQGAQSTEPATVTLSFPAQVAGLQVALLDSITNAAIDNDYLWTIEEDTTIKHTAGVSSGPNGKVIGNSFHSSNMPLIATGCTGSASCGDGQKIGDSVAPQKSRLNPADVALDPLKTYYISILPGDAGNVASGMDVGHAMGGATIAPGQKNVKVLVPPQVPPTNSQGSGLPTAQLSIFIYEDSSPTNGAVDGTEVNLGLGGFAITLDDVAASSGDAIGQMTYDAFNMPLSNALLGIDGCPATVPAGTPVGVVYTCPEPSASEITAANTTALKTALNVKYALRGHALIKYLMPLRYDVIANPAPEREGLGEKWIQTETLEGTKAQDAFAKIGEPTYFQEFGPPGFHATIGFVNPDHVKLANNGTSVGYNITGEITNLHMSRPISVTNFDSNSHAPLVHTTCYVGLNTQAGNGPNIAMTTCDQDGNFTLTNIPDGAHELVIWDQWLDQIMGTAAVTVSGSDVAMGTIPEFSWFTHVETSTFLDLNANGVREAGEPGIAEVPTTIRYRDGRISNVLLTDSNGISAFNELFPLFNWYVTESDTTRYKGTGVNTVVDGGGMPDVSGPYAGILTSTYPTGGTTVKQYPGSTQMLGLQGFISETNILDWGKAPYNMGENGGITGFVTYTSTRGFDDPGLEVQFKWEPGVPRVTVNLYQETTNPDGTIDLKFVQSTTSSSWDDWVNALDTNGHQLNMNCPGQIPDGVPPNGDPYVGQMLGGDITRCYDGFHNWNQIQPAAYDGRYYFKNIQPGKYVVEVVPPVGYEIVKEEDKNILIGDPWYMDPNEYKPQFAGLSNIFILPDQATLNAVEGPPPGIKFAKCVGNLHRVPDFLTMFPAAGQVAPFAGADRALCNRKEVILEDQMQANADFHLFTPAPIASHYTGMILDDTSNEFNVVSPDFGEKFGVPFVPVSIKDFNGVEISRVYADEWGMFNGLTPSTWEPNVPNPSGYSPNMLITCMNDPGPILGPKGTLITDPFYNPMYSNFCYTNPFMPGATDYLDTPVVPVAAFASGYNPPDCALPATTPAILRVDSSSGIGPWLPIANGTGILTIQALGDIQVLNPAYAGPAATNPKIITRHYGFGVGSSGTVAIVDVNGRNWPLSVTSWSDSTITATVNGTTPSGELVITTADGHKSVNTVTVTIEAQTGTSPTRVSSGGSIQAAIDAATPGDLILVDAGTYNELVVMDKPVRLQGVGAASVIINAAKYPTNKLENWRPRINKDFGIDASGNQTFPAVVDPLPGQEITGGIVLLEPSVLGTEEGAGITVLAKGLAADGVTPLTNNAVDCSGGHNFKCAPSRIDGLSVTGGDSGGGIFVNGWAHNLEIANTHIYGNAGAYNGGIRVGVPYREGQVLPNFTRRNRLNKWVGFNLNTNINIHHNAITQNGAVESNNGSAGAGGGLSMCSGADNYKVNYNFICGNFSLGDGGGVGHIGVSVDGLIQNNQILFNQSYNPDGSVSGGGIVIMGEDSATTLTLGSGDVTVDANLIQGNFAQAGHGGGIRVETVSGVEAAFNNLSTDKFWKITLTNNMIVNNVAGYSGGGISLLDAVNVDIIGNTVASNDSTATVGALVGANPTASSPQPAGISSALISPALSALISDSNLKTFSNPKLQNNILWQNRAFHFSGSGVAGGTATLMSDDYWDLGILGDTSPTPGKKKLNPINSILTSISGYNPNKNNNISDDPLLINSYFNGARDGSDGSSGPMTVAIAADEGGNAVDLRYGPLVPMGDYHIQVWSPAIDSGAMPTSTMLSTDPTLKHDFDFDPRPINQFYDIGADEVMKEQGIVSFTPNPVVFNGTNIVQKGSSGSIIVTVTNTGSASMTITNAAVSGNHAFVKGIDGCSGLTIDIGKSCTIAVTFSPSDLTSVTGTLTLTDNGAASPQSLNLSGQGVVPSGTVTPTSLGFGNVLINTPSTSQPVVLTNTGVGPLAFNSITFTGPGNTNFTQTNNCPANVPVGGNCTINVTFTPNNTTPRTVTMHVNDGAGTQSVLMTGMGALANVVFSGSTTLTASNARSVLTTIRNAGTAPLIISNITIVVNSGQTNPGTFSVANPGAGTPACPIGGAGLAAGASCQVTVTYTPPTAGRLNTRGTLSLTDTGASTTIQTRVYTGN